MTFKLARIVVATDFSADAGHAARRGAMLAGQQLELIHVVSRPSLDAVRHWRHRSASRRRCASRSRRA